MSLTKKTQQPHKQNPTNPLITKTPRRLTCEEIEEKKAKGICFICDEPYTPNHHLKHKRDQLYLIEGGGDNEAILGEEEARGEHIGHEEEDISQISVHDISDSTRF